MFLVVPLSIIYLFLAAMVFLPETSIFDHGYVFVDDRYQNIATMFVSAIPVLLVAMLNKLPKTVFGICMNLLLIPIAFCSVLVIIVCAGMLFFHLPSPFHCSVGPTTQVNGFAMANNGGAKRLANCMFIRPTFARRV